MVSLLFYHNKEHIEFHIRLAVLTNSISELKTMKLVHLKVLQVYNLLSKFYITLLCLCVIMILSIKKLHSEMEASSGLSLVCKV